ncbi:MAG: transporter [Xanthomonadales bacterium]
MRSGAATRRWSGDLRATRAAIVACLALALLLVPAGVAAQELSPRAYWPAPVGTRVLVTGYAHASGDVLLDPTLPVYGVDSRISTFFLGYVETFALGGRNANLLLEAPYSWGATRGLLGDTPARTEFAGLNDLAATLSVNLLGAPALTTDEFAQLRAQPRPIVGVSFKLVPPTGYYHSDRFINVGSNRWAGRLQLGAMFPLRPRWLLELDAGAWLFGDDADYPGGRREQDPIYAFEAHLVHRIRPGLWASFDVNAFVGGRQTIDGEEREDLQRNTRLGATVAVPFLGRHVVKFGYSTAARTRFGSDSEQLLLTYQFLIQ